MGTGWPPSSPCGAGQAPHVQGRERSPSFASLSQRRLRTAAKQNRSAALGVCELSAAARPALRDPAASQGRGCQDLRPWGFSRAALHLAVMLSPLCLYDRELPCPYASPSKLLGTASARPLGVAVVVAVAPSLNFGIPPEQLIFYCFRPFSNPRPRVLNLFSSTGA